MSVDADLYGPVTNVPVPVVVSQQSGDGILRQKFSLTVDIQLSRERSLYTRVATEMMDYIVLEHQSRPNLLDVRNTTRTPKAALDLIEVVQRFHDGNTEIWVSRPKHMPADRFNFEGQFGYFRVNKMPLLGGPLGYVAWSWLVTERGQLPVIDLGLIMLPTGDRWCRVFRDKADADSYYLS